eukprot:7538872-Pyramimonas_sp.AAC.1
MLSITVLNAAGTMASAVGWALASTTLRSGLANSAPPSVKPTVIWCFAQVALQKRPPTMEAGRPRQI